MTTSYAKSYVKALQAHFSQAANAENAVSMAKYMRNQFEFLGIKSPLRTCLQKQFITERERPCVSYLDKVVPTLWQLPEREYQYAAIDFLDSARKELTPNIAPTLETCILQKSWWDTIDPIAIHLVGHLMTVYRQDMQPYLEKWRNDDNFWLRRTTLLFQLSYKNRTDETLLFSLVKENLGSREFFINKAIGWALREYSKTAPQAVVKFVNSTELPALSKREALKWLKKRSL